MKHFGCIITLSSCLALACSGMLMSTGCGISSEDHVDSSQVSLEIRFQDDAAASAQPPTVRLQRLASQAAGPTTHDTVARVLVDITFADSGLPFFLNFDLTKLAPDVWRGDVPLLPRNQQLRFVAHALGAAGEVAFSGETVATLTVDNQGLQIPLAPAQNGQTFEMPRMLRIVYPAEMTSGQEEQVAFTIEGNAGAAIGIQITPVGTPGTPAAELSPATGTVTLTNTVADFMTVYTPPEVTVNTRFDYQVTITDATAQSAVAITTNFSIHVKPRPPGGAFVHDPRLSVLFNPVILRLTANGSETPGTVELIAAVSDDSAPDKLAFQWSYTPNTGTPGATFANNGQGNPGLFQGYTVDHEGTLTLAVTDEQNGTTTLHYQLGPNQFADAINHISLKRIVSGDAHTCVLTDQNRVRCWGDNQFGQLGYGNAIDLGDAPTRLPDVAGDVPLPVSDPVLQLVAGNNHTCVLLESGLVYCWGDNQFGQLGYGRTDNLGDGEPVTSFGYVTLGDLATRIAAGGDHTCAILTSGALRCWGRNDFGQLGRGHTRNIGDDEIVFIAGDVDLGAGITVRDLALGDFHTCALLTTGAVRCWGRNDVGQLGYGNTTNLGDNEPINNLPDVSLTGATRKLVAGSLHTCALTFAGTLRCWGDGRFGQLGQSFGGSDASWGDAADELPGNLPGDINTGAQIIDVTAGDNHTCALSSDGQLKCWGRGDSGQLGYGNFNNLGAPPAAGVDLDGVTAYRISAGAAHTCALRNNGTARCWGQGADGRLGRGSMASSATATGNVDIQIFTPLHTVGGTVIGLAGSGLVLSNNGGDDLPVNTNGTFTFPTAISDLSSYAVTVRTQPTNRSQTCTVSNGSGNLAGANVTNVAITCVTNRFTVSGTVIGLTGAGMVLQDNGRDDLTLSGDGSFTFTTPIASGATFDVTVLTQPSQPTQTCTVTSGTGTVGNGNITNVAVTCTTTVFTVGGTVSGLAAGDSITLRNSGGDDLIRSSNGSFTFATPVASGQPYAVTIVANPISPISQTCTVGSGAGRVGNGNVTNVAVTCTTNTFTIGGTVSGLAAGDSITLRDNGGDTLIRSANGSFTFTTPLASGQPYAVTVVSPTSPISQTCTVTSGTGTVGSSNITDIAVTCTTNVFTIGGTVSGLAAGDSITLRNNGGDTLIRSASGSFTFTTPLASGQPYAVTVVSPTSPISQTCTVGSGAGTVGNGNVTNVVVTCTINTFTIGGTVSGLAAGDSITLRDNGGDALIRSANGGFTFTTPLASGQPYAVTVVSPTSPISQTCTVGSGAGTVSGGNVANVAVTCTTNAFTVGGTVTGFTGTGLVLQKNGGGDLPILGNGGFTFATPVASGATYSVAVKAQLPGQTCTVANGIGTVGASNVTNVQVTCVLTWSPSLFPIAMPGSNVGLGDLALDNNGDLLVVVANPARAIVRVNHVTGAQTTVATGIGPATNFLLGIAFRAANNMIYMSSSDGGGTSLIFAVTPTGSVTQLTTMSDTLNAITIAPPSFGSFAGFIIGVTQGGLVVAVNPTNGAVTTITAAAGAASDLTFAPNGTLFICGTGTVRTVTAAGVVSTFASGFGSADGITITPDGARMFIADSGTDTVRQVTIPGAVVTTFVSADIDDGFGVGGILAAPGNTLIVMTGETSLTLRAFAF